MPQPIRAEHIIGKFPNKWVEIPTSDMSNSWTANATIKPRYKYIEAINSVHIVGRFVPGVETNGTLIYTLPDGLWPSIGQSHIVCTDTAGAAGARFFVTSSGQVQIYSADTAGTFYDVNILVYLD